MAKIPFTLESWLKDKSQKVETRDGRPVKIISFEMTDTNDCPIAAQFRLCAGTPVVYLFDKEGHYKGEGDSDYNLFLITPEPELSEFEQAVIDYKYGGHDSSLFDSGYFDKARNEAAELLDLARKELKKTFVLLHKEDYQTAFDLGKAEALKDLPRWKKIGRGNNYSSEVEFSINGRYLEMNDTLNDVYEIKLLDLEKLPSFKED